jgi:hypothetical protein
MALEAWAFETQRPNFGRGTWVKRVCSAWNLAVVFAVLNAVYYGRPPRAIGSALLGLAQMKSVREHDVTRYVVGVII